MTVSAFLRQAFPHVDQELVSVMAATLEQKPAAAPGALNDEIEDLKDRLKEAEDEAIRLNQKLLAHMLATRNATQGGLDVLAERAFHNEKGFTTDHDDAHSNYEMISAAIAHLSDARLRTQGINGYTTTPPPEWPLDDKSWKSKATVAESLIVAASFIVAEIDRLYRGGLDKI